MSNNDIPTGHDDDQPQINISNIDIDPCQSCGAPNIIWSCDCTA